MNGRLRMSSPLLLETFHLVGSVLFVVSIIIGDSLLFFSGAILVAFGIYPPLYLKYVCRRLRHVDKSEKLYLSQGDEGEFRLIFSYTGKLPLVYGDALFFQGPHTRVEAMRRSGKNRYRFPFSLAAHETANFVVPVQAVSRGIDKMNQFEVTVTDPLRLMEARLFYDFVHKKVVVYPERKEVYGFRQLSLPFEGEQPHQHSLFHDVQASVGTRDYAPSDSLKAIHWKASARMDRLQTKVFEKTMGMTWSVLILMGKEMTKRQTAQLEDQLSYVSAVCYAAQKQGVDVELFVNMKPPGRSNVTHLPPARERVHYIKALEFLSLIQFKHLKTNANTAVYEVDHLFTQPRVIMVVDQTDDEGVKAYYRKWMGQGHKVFIIQDDGLLQSVEREGKLLAT
ncbi:MAG TPA: DUF58 domain-containing protein [Bacillales bacterium]|nr:DUF58 domain-containing protein [Bacillales bacterium]